MEYGELETDEVEQLRQHNRDWAIKHGQYYTEPQVIDTGRKLEPHEVDFISDYREARRIFNATEEAFRTKWIAEHHPDLNKEQVDTILTQIDIAHKNLDQLSFIREFERLYGFAQEFMTVTAGKNVLNVLDEMVKIQTKPVQIPRDEPSGIGFQIRRK